MTINALATYQGPYYPNGITKNFPFAEFEVVDTDTVLAVLDGVELDPATFYVSLNDDGTGEVVFFTAPAGDGLTNELFLYSNPDFRQQSTLANQGPYYQETIEKIVDRIAVATIWLRDRVLRSPVPPVPVGDIAGKYPVVLPDGSWGWASGTGADNGLRTDLAASGGSSIVAWLRAATGAVTRTITAKFFGYVDVEDFGAVGNGVVNDTLAWTRGIDFVKTRGLKLRAMSPAYLVGELVLDGSDYELVTTSGNKFKQLSGLTGDGGVHPIFFISGSRIRVGDLTLEGNIDTDEDEYSHGILISSAKDVTIGNVHGKNLRGDVIYVYGRLSSEAERSRGIVIGNVTGDNILRCIVAVAGGQGRCGDVRRVGSMRVGYKDVDIELNESLGTSGDYQNVDFEFGHIHGATVQVVSADDDVQNYRVKFAGHILNGDLILNSDPPYSGHPGSNDFAISVNDVSSADLGDIWISGYDFSPIRIGKKVGRFSYKSLRFSNVARTDNTYKSVILHYTTDSPGIVKGDYTEGELYNNTRMIFRSNDGVLLLDMGRIDVTGGLFGSNLTGRALSIRLDCGDPAGEIIFSSVDGFEGGKSAITNNDGGYLFYDCDDFTMRGWDVEYNALEYSNLSSNIVAINSTINGVAFDGMNYLKGGAIFMSGEKVLGAQGAAVADAAGGSVIDTEARATANALAARLRAHGVIDT